MSKVRHFPGLQVEEVADIVDVSLRRFVRFHLAVNAVHLTADHTGLLDQVLLHHPKIAVRMVRRYCPFIRKEQVNAVPFEFRRGQRVEIRRRRHASGNRHRRTFLAG